MKPIKKRLSKKEQSKARSKARRKWWRDLKKDPVRYAKVVKNISEASIAASATPETKARRAKMEATPKRKRQKSEARSRLNKTKAFKNLMKLVNADPVRAKKISKSKKKQWQDEEFRNRVIPAIIKSRDNHPNKLEKRMTDVLSTEFGYKYEFVGDGSYMTCGCNPDFRHTYFKKRLIEINGTYYHNLDDQPMIDKKRLKRLKKGGYQVLVVWDNELDDLRKLRKKIRRFHKKCVTTI